MKIKIIAVGTLKEKYLKEFSGEYVKRLSKYTKIEIVEVKEEKDSIPNAKDKEGLSLLKFVNEKDYVIALTLNKKEFTSDELASWLDRTMLKVRNPITFIIGGSLGLSNEVIKRANECITLSKLTFTHQMSRIILLEQLYRCFKINHHEEYHK